jgi:hypothetical protein
VAVIGLCGCRQLLGIETASSTEPDGPTDGPSIRDSSDAARTSGCPAAYTGSPDSTSRYRVAAMTADWITAAQDCANDQSDAPTTRHTHLVVLDDDQERIAIGMETPFGFGGWLGLSDRITEGVFLAVTNQVGVNYPPASGPPWAANEPNGSFVENCVIINGSDLLATVDCTQQQFYACECDDSPDEPANY